MRTNLDEMLAAAARVVEKRNELAEAEARFAHLAGVKTDRKKLGTTLVVGQRAAPTGSSRATSAARVSVKDEGPSVASQVEKLLSSGDKRYSFSEILSAVGGREKRFAVKSKLNKLRAEKLVKFSNGFYQRAAPKQKTPGKLPKNGRPTGGVVVSASADG